MFLFHYLVEGVLDECKRDQSRLAMEVVRWRLVALVLVLWFLGAVGIAVCIARG